MIKDYAFWMSPSGVYFLFYKAGVVAVVCVGVWVWVGGGGGVCVRVRSPAHFGKSDF